MIIAYEWRPSELIRRVIGFCEDTCVDFDLRFPEARSRRLLELELHRIFESSLHEILDEVGLKHSKISRWDWAILWEWNERWKRLSLMAKTTKCLQRLSELSITANADQKSLLEALQKNIIRIQSELETAAISMRPAIWQLVRLRWRSSELSRHFYYFEKRIAALS